MIMRRIASPEYAPAIKIDVSSDFGEEEYQRVMEQRNWVLDTFDAAVQTYIDEYAYAEPEMFPSLARLNGEYYISREGYWVIDEKWRIKEHWFSIMACCLEDRDLGEDQDYLGLEVHFTWLPESGEILYQGDVDSSSI